MEPPEREVKLPAQLAHRVLLVLEFHRWGGTAEGVTGGDTIYFGNYSNLRKDTLALQGLCEEITAGLRGGLPDKAETLLAAGRMYRRSADYVKAGEYFLRVLDLVYKRSECA